MDYEKGFLVYEISNIIPEMHLPYDPTVGEGNYTNREEVSYRDEDYHIAPVEEKYEVFSNFLKTVKQSHKKQKLSG